MTVFQGSKYSYFVVLAADIISFITGTSIAWSSPIIAILESDDVDKIPLGRQITKDEESWIGSLSAMGGIFGPLIFGFLVQTIGRKTAVAVLALPFLGAYLIAAFAQTVPLFYVARILMGLGLGGMFCIVPIFIVETVEDVNRGLLQASSTAFLMFGILFSYCVGPYASIMVFNLILALICIVYIPIFWYAATETPYYLVGVGKEEMALKSLRYLRRKPSLDLQVELEDIKCHFNETKSGSFFDIFNTRGTRKAFFCALAVTTLQQLSGVSAILFYNQSIFDATGSDLPPEVCSIIVGSVQFVSSFASPPFVDRAGRRFLLLVTATGAMSAEILLGVYFYLQENGEDVSGIGWLPVVSLVGYIIFFNFGMGAIPWAIMGEILPLNVISKAAVVITSFYWLVGFFLTKYFVYLGDVIGMGGIFWLFAGFCLLLDFFVYFFMFETKGKSLKEIQEILNR